MTQRKKSLVRKQTKSPSQRLSKTAKELRRISEEIAPFVRRQKLTEYTSAGQWRGNNPAEVCLPKDDEDQIAAY